MKYRKNFYQIKSNEEIFQKLEKERDEVGYYSLPFQETVEIKNYAKTVQQKYIVVIGIGGSTLGTRAIYEFLLPSQNYSKKLYFLETTDPLKIKLVLDEIEINNTHFLVISKSGTTIETISIFKYIASLIKISSLNCTIISEKNTTLFSYALSNSIKIFELDKNIGGRFSVFSVVGLVPLAIVGVDIDNILFGCKKVNQSFFNKGKYYFDIMEKARFLVENKNRFNINILFSYTSLLESFNKWYIQLWGESLGKININGTRQGLTPIGLIGPVDQHSFLQLIMEGKRDKTVTFITIDNFKSLSKVPSNTLTSFSGLEYLDNMYFSELINKQATATIEAVESQEDIPCDTISINTIDAYNIATLMYGFQLLTSIIGAFLQINTYDQPGVELGKTILKEKISK